MSYRLELKNIHLTRCVDMLQNTNPGIYAGESFSKMLSSTKINNHAALNFSGFRYALAIVANKLYDNPFVNINKNSDFNANPYIIGYYPLGMYLYGVCIWLITQLQKSHYGTIHFIARDGFLLKQIYDIIRGKLYPSLPPSNYLFVSRKALLPLMIESKGDLYSLEYAINIYANSPHKLIDYLAPIIPAELFQSAGEIFAANNLIFDKIFATHEEYDLFIKIFLKHFYDKNHIKIYRDGMREYFAQIIGHNDCTFDIGYSGRTEMILSRLLNIKLDAYYIHTHSQIANNNAKKAGFSLHTFMEQTPIVAGTVREIFLSDSIPSCIGYKKTAGPMEPIFGHLETSYQQDFILSQIQKGAIDFANNMCEFSQSMHEDLVFRPADMALPFEYYLNSGKYLDRSILKCIEFEDDLFLGKKVNAFDFWTGQIANVSTYAHGIDVLSLPKWKKAIYYALFDWKTLKEKVYQRYEHRPIVFHITRTCYRAARKIYHIFK